jgi:hypothetical protein
VSNLCDLFELLCTRQEIKLAQGTLDKAKLEASIGEGGAPAQDHASPAGKQSTSSSSALGLHKDGSAAVVESAAGSPSKQDRTCGLCGERGHNKRTCPKAATTNAPAQSESIVNEQARKRAASEPADLTGLAGFGSGGSRSAVSEEQDQSMCTNLHVYVCRSLFEGIDCPRRTRETYAQALATAHVHCTCTYPCDRATRTRHTPDEEEAEDRPKKRGRRAGSKNTPRTDLADLSLPTLRAICTDLGLATSGTMTEVAACIWRQTISVLIVISYVASRFQSPIAVVSPARLHWRYPIAARRFARRGVGGGGGRGSTRRAWRAAHVFPLCACDCLS